MDFKVIHNDSFLKVAWSKNQRSAQPLTIVYKREEKPVFNLYQY